MNIIFCIEIMLILFFSIFILMRLKEYLFKRYNFISKWYEEYVFLSIFVIGLSLFGSFYDVEILRVSSIPFLVYMVIPLIFKALKYLISLWSEFFGVLTVYLRIKGLL